MGSNGFGRGSRHSLIREEFLGTAMNLSSGDHPCFGEDLSHQQGAIKVSDFVTIVVPPNQTMYVTDNLRGTHM